MKITVNKDNVKMEEFDVVHEGEHRVNKCSFSFSEEYTEELVKKAIFTSQNSSVEVAIINNECNIPTEILKARNIVLLGVYAYKVVDDKLDLRYSPSPDAFKVNSGSYIEGASKSEEITPSQFEQYMQALNDGLNKVEESIKKMDEATSSATQLVDDINQKLENGDFIGPEGTQGPQGVPGNDGTNGQDGVGITTITSGQSSVEADKTITPVTVQKSDGSSQSFKVEAKNGQDGLTPVIGDNGNWFIGDTDTGKPSRGEVGPSPDLSNYVKNTDYAKDGQGGVISTGNHFRVYSNNGVPYVNSINSEQYSSSGDNIFVGKGTLESIKDDYVGSSNPVITLNNTLDNLVRKNRVSDYIVSLKDALKYKVFEFLVHGKTQQETTTGKNLFDYTTVRSTSGLTTTINSDGSITTKGTPTESYIKLVLEKDYNDKLDDGETYTISQDVAGYIYLQIYAVPKDGGSTIYYVSSNSQTRKEASFTVNKSIYDYRATLQSGLIADVGEDINFTAKFQLEKGSKATEFEKYTGGQPSPSPDYPQPITTLTFDKITRCGKNLATENFANQNSSINLARTLKKGEKITIVVNMTATDNPPSGYGINIYDQDNEQLWGNSYTNWQPPYDGWNSFVVTVKNDTNRLRINSYGYQEVEISTAILIGALVVENKYVNDGSLYEPYQGQTYDIDLQGNEMVELPNGVRNKFMVDKEGNVSLIKNVGKVVYTNMNGFSNNGQNTERIQYLTPVIENIPLSYGDQLDNIFKSNVISSIYVQDGTSFAGTTASSKIRVSISREFLNIHEESNSGYLNALDELLQSLNESGNPFTIYYPLATSEVIPLGNLTDLITTEEGINTFFINGNLETTLEVLYALDIKKYIDNKLAEISSAVIEEG